MRKYLILISIFIFLKINAQNTENQMINLLKEISNSNSLSEENAQLQEKFILKFQEIIEENQPFDWEKLKDYYVSVIFSETASKKYRIYSMTCQKSYPKYYNFILQKSDNNKFKVIKKVEGFRYFKEIHDLGKNDFLIIQQLNDMSFACYEAWVFHYENEIFTLKNAFTNKDKKLAVCSFTNVDMGEEYLTYYDPIKINFDSSRKEICYFVEVWNAKKNKKETRIVKAKYKRGKFRIKNYDERIFE